MNFYFVVVHASGIEVIYFQQKYEQTHFETTLTKIFVTRPHLWCFGDEKSVIREGGSLSTFCDQIEKHHKFSDKHIFIVNIFAL